MKQIVISETAKSKVNNSNYQKIINEVSNSSKLNGIVKGINYIIKNKTIILF